MYAVVGMYSCGFLLELHTRKHGKAKLNCSVIETFFTSCANELAEVRLRSNLELPQLNFLRTGLWIFWRGRSEVNEGPEAGS
jgi:hypothetical protein